MIFHQLFEPLSSTYTNLLACEDAGQAVRVDPVLPAWRRDLEALNRLDLKLVYAMDTHIHADHISAAATPKREVGSRIAHPAGDGLDCVDQPVEEGRALTGGSIRFELLFTPGHTDGRYTCRVGERRQGQASSNPPQGYRL